MLKGLGAAIVAPSLLLAGASEAEAQSVRRRIVRNARNYLGVPYVEGGENPRRGLDCESFVYHAMADCGIWVPRGTYDQAAGGYPRIGDWKEGDVLFFDEQGDGVSHVGIGSYNGYVIHASTYFGEVAESYAKAISDYSGRPALAGARVYRA
jgi:peptidoglycan DL-endopeptidase CwlO